MIHGIFNKKGYGKEYFMKKHNTSSEEIKEILDNMKEISSFEYTTNWFELNYEDTKILLDYITNLQEENELYLRRSYEAYEIKEEYKLRIDKAIEYIQEEFCQVNKETKELECWHERVKPILDILKGVNNE